MLRLVIVWNKHQRRNIALWKAPSTHFIYVCLYNYLLAPTPINNLVNFIPILLSCQTFGGTSDKQLSDFKDPIPGRSRLFSARLTRITFLIRATMTEIISHSPEWVPRSLDYLFLLKIHEELERLWRGSDLLWLPCLSWKISLGWGAASCMRCSVCSLSTK